MKKLAACLLIAWMLVASLAMPAMAIDMFDPNEELSLAVNFMVDGQCAKGVEFSLYRVANMEGFGDMELTRAFQDCGATKLVDLSTDETQKLCETLYSHLLAHTDILPQDHGVCDTNGQVRFPVQADTLEPGLYLLVSNRFYANGVSHEAAPFIVSLPYRGEDDVWIYDMSVSPKTADNQISVQKIWQDTGYEKNRPANVTVELLQGTDKTVYATVVLSEANNWQYTWKDLPGGYQWTIREVLKSDCYKSYIDRVSGGYRIINTYSPPLGKTLPQTGLLWWPIPILACAGVLLFVLGWARQRKSEE